MPSILHAHSWHSLLEGVASPKALVQRAAEGGYGSLALTDTNGLYGVVPFVAAATRAGVRPL
ncbi:MAG: PHP domain-containing protein, partial [Gemmataceae bacterium]|nr:PHP domain-containing protein [Gemmataceae bacterium]